MAELVAIATFLALSAGIALYGFRVYARPARILKQLRDAPQPAAPQPVETIGSGDQGAQSSLVRTIRMVGEKVPISPEAAGTARQYLMAAGFRNESAVRMLYGIKATLLVLLTLLLAGPAVAMTAKPMTRVAFLGASACLGWFGPGLVLEKLVKRRREAIRLALPDALDLIVVCVEAGHGLDQALLRVTQELRSTHKEICDELGLLTLEMRAGKRRAEALRNLADRSGEEELRKLTAIMIQADRFGTSIGDSLRTHADFLRMKRRQDAEERANKVGVKLVFPIFFCILPSMFVVTAGPGVLAIVNNLLPALKQAGGH